MRRLILRPGAIGDCILALPAMEYLAAGNTEVWISAPVVPLVRFASTVRALSSTGIDLIGIGDLPASESLARRLASFESIVSWYGSNREEFRQALSAINPHCEFLRALPPPEYAGHATSFFCEQVGMTDALPTIKLDERCDLRDTIAIHPFSGGVRKNWPVEAYRELARRLPYPVDWLAGPEEELPEAKRFNDLRELALWLKGARLYVGNDSGITHLAAACGVPTLALFGPSDPVRWAPRGPNVTVLRHEPLPELSVEAVVEVVNRLLG